ncbi:MAG: LamG domain-containing protein [Planctomycetota bacterium]|jgi:hypothetical protein
MYRKMICPVSFVLVLALILTNFAQADLIGYWRFDESSGTIAADSAGGDNDGILFGDQLEWTAGMFGGALSHGGLWDAGVEIPTTGMLATTGTVTMWGLLADPQPAHTKYFFGHTTQPQWANRVQLYMDEGDNLLDIGLGNSHTRDTDIMELPMEEWLHVALTWDSGHYMVYVNGEEVSSGAYIKLSEIHPTANIGNDGSLGPYEGFAGLLDEVRLYDHTLNDAEILAAMEGIELFDVTAPGDAIQGVPVDWLSSYLPEPHLAIDNNIETKYQHFKGEIETTGFQVTPRSGPSIVTGLTLTTANDFPTHDPIVFELYGSNESIDGPYELISSGYIIDFAQAEAWPRLTMNATPISFYNDVAYGHYQVLFPAVRSAGRASSMQIAEVELLGVPAPSPEPAGASIILVTEALDWDLDGLRDDHALESFLVSEGHIVDVRPDYWKVLTPDKIAELNAADLIIFSRLAWSNHYNDGKETTEWNSLTTPLLQMSAYFASNTRWKWVNSGINSHTPHIHAEAVKPNHPVFRGMPLTLYDPAAPNGPLNVVQIIDPLIGTGLTPFIGGTDMGNGQLIAKPVGFEMGWIAEWDVGVEFFEGAGQYAGGRRMLFCAGTQRIQFLDPDTQEVITTAQGELNLTAEGLQMFRNAIDYLLGGTHIILVTEEIDRDSDGLRDDHTLESFLISEGHSVDVRPEYWNMLTPDKIAELNAANLIIVSRLAWSSRYNQDNETTEWNSLTTPLLQMNSHFARNTRWKWVNSEAREPDDTSYIYAGAVDQHHPIFQGVPMTLYDKTLRGGPLNAVEMIDPLVGTGFTAFIGGTDMGNGQLIAKPVGLEMGWIAEWDVGVEFFEGAGQYAGGRRMLFCAGTRVIHFVDPDTQEVISTVSGELNLTVEGLQMFRNAIDYLLEPKFTGGIIEPGI